MDENLALSLQFILLDEDLVMKQGVVNYELLGQPYIAYLAGNLSNSPITEIVYEGKRVFVFRRFDFSMLKQRLADFTDNNCFLGKEKPVPRLERNELDEGHFWLYLEKGKRDLQLADVTAIAKLFDKPWLPYEDQPLFKSEWKQIVPVNTKGMTAICAAVAESLNESLPDNIEIHEFKIWKI